MAKKKAKPKAKAEPEETFEEALAELEAVVADLEGGELGLGDSLKRYEEGVARLRRCHAQLDAAERRIELLSGVDADGNPLTEPFDAEATTGETQRARKRSTRPPQGRPGADVDDSPQLF